MQICSNNTMIQIKQFYNQDRSQIIFQLIKYIYYIMMLKGNKLVLFALVFFTLALAVTSIQPSLLLPIESTKGVYTQYSIWFTPQSTVPLSAKINVIFPFEFDPRALISYTGCKLQRSTGSLTTVPCTISNRTFTVDAGAIAIESMIVVISNILNPVDSDMSSQFTVQTLFKQVIVESNSDFGKTPFTAAPINGGSTMTVNNFENVLVEMGSSWVFQFTLSKSYPTNTSIRFIFPEGFSTVKIQCNITGVSDSSQQTRVFPNGRVYDCLNVKSNILTTQKIIVSGIINPNYELTVNSIQAHVLQPNSVVVLQKIAMNPATPVTISHKNMNVTVTIPNQFRNNTLTYIFQLNMDSDLSSDDYMELMLTGNWTYFIQDSVFIEGINADAYHTPVFTAKYNWPTYTKLTISNFSSIMRSSQTAFYVSLRTPLIANTYTLTLSAYRKNGGLVEQYSQPVVINATTGYIREMKLHPMIQAIKLPVGQTGPLEFTLGLRNNLPQTNVLTYGKLVIKITPNLPLPNVATNGVPKCYFYGNIEAQSYSYDATNPAYTTVIAYTPVDFNFQSSQIPFMITTEGYTNPIYEGLTIDTLVKRYHFHIQFYTDYSPEPVPTQVIFGDWVADSVPMTTFSCNTMIAATRHWDHIVCTFTTPAQDLCQPGYFHFFRIEFTGTNSWYGWHNQLGYNANHVYPDYPCIANGSNLIANPYIKCDLVTWQSGPYASELTRSYVNIYGFQLLPGGSTITVQIPKIQRYTSGYDTKLRFTILQDTWGYQTDYITLYSQLISTTGSYYVSSTYDTYNPETPTILLTNPVINKVTDITLTSYNLGQAGVTQIIFEVDQTLFADIGRGYNIACGSHFCSKFNKPVQYFILYPSRAMAATETLTFPAITTPVYSGQFPFNLRIYSNNNIVKYVTFNVAITPETLNAPTFTFSTLESQTSIYPKTDHYYTVSFTTKNPLPAATSYIQITFNNYFTMSSQYCVLTTTAVANDTRGIECEVWTNDNKLFLQNLGAVPAGTVFTVSVQMRTTSSAGTISPTVSIVTYYSPNNIVDRVLNAPFSAPTATLTNTNLQTLTTFTVPNPQTIERKPTMGYFGHLLIKFRPIVSNSVSIGYFLKFTFTNDFYPYSNQLNLPLSCTINGARFACTYTLAPFVVTISQITNQINLGSDNFVNITTQYLDLNGIYYPATQGRYLIQAQVINNTNTEIYETVQQYIDILPGTVSFYNVTFGHRDTNKENIFEVRFRTGATPVPAYNDATTAGRIYIGFPTKDDANNDVFASNLGFSSGIGTVIPCWFQTGAGYISAVTGTNLTCKLRDSPYAPKFVYVEIINFNLMPAYTNVKIVMAKIFNPVPQKYDVNFMLQINSINAATKQQAGLYESYYNMFFNMLSPSVTNRNEVDSTTTMFGPGSKVGDYGKYINVSPYTGTGTFSTGDWFIVEMNSEFPLNGQYAGCLPIFYQNCIVFREINWFAIKIGNTTILPLQAYVLRLPTSISRVDTTYKVYTYLSTRYSQIITYTITANYRWLQLRGSITGFSFQVLGSQDKLNIGQKNVDVMVTFTTSHITYRGGTIQIKFPTTATTVPIIRPHCRSVVTSGSQLQGYPTGKPATNIQGDVGCLVQNTYSWVITSYDELPANSQVSIVGNIDLPTVQTASLGMGYVITYINTDATNVTANGRIIDYLYTNFPLQVNNKTWNLDVNPTMHKSQALRANHVGELKFKLKLAASLYGTDNGGGYVDISVWRYTVLGSSNGFNGPTTNLVCKIVGITLNQRFGCQVIAATAYANYYTYRLQSIEVLNANTDYEYTLTTLNGNTVEGINFPTYQGIYKIEGIVKYSSGNSQQVSQAHYIEVFGPDFRVLNIISTISIPNEYNMILVEFIPPQNISPTTEQIVIQIPCSAADGTPLFPEDLGMGYTDYDDLVFDLYESSITSMTCKVFIGDKTNHQPVKVICSSFSATLTTSTTVKFGFWVKNPITSVGLAIPVRVYSLDIYGTRKNAWSVIEAAINVLPTTTTPIADLGNFYVSTSSRQISGVNFELTTRNTRAMSQNDLYILKFNFDLRMTQKYAGSFKYNSGFGGVGDVIFMQNCKTVLLRVGATSLALTSTGSTATNARIEAVFYNPSIQLSTAEAKITAYAAYVALGQGQVINHNDAFPYLPPREMTSPTFSMTAVNGNLNKGSREDYAFTVVYSTSSSAADMALVKKISIQFPLFTTYDFTFANTECIENPSSTIEVDKCWIDTTTYTIWIVPVIKGSYINSNNFMIETRGFSIINPINNPSINQNQFVIRYYTWKSAAQPVLYANTDDYVFFRQDSSNIASSTILTYVTTFLDKHTSLSIPREPYVNQFEPGSGDVGTNRMKTPFEFIVKAMAVFNAVTGGSYHEVRLTFGSYYTTPTLNQQVSNDLYIYVPTCYLNGVLLHYCTISGTKIITRFQQGFSVGAEMAFRFSVLNQQNEADDGFYMTSISNPTITLPLEFYPSGGSSYYAEAEPFHSWQRISGTYPQLGIYSVSMSVGTHVIGKINYLEFSLSFSRSDINGLVLEIPCVAPDGTIIYNDPTLLNLPSGSQYPCSVGINANVYCWYEKGSNSDYGRPTRIFITNFGSVTSLSLRMLFTNPGVVGVFPNFNFKAFGGSYSAPNFMGSQLMGRYSVIDPYKTLPEVGYYASGSTYITYPNRNLYSKSTVYDFYITQAMNTNSYVIVQWILTSPTYGDLSEYEMVSSYINDYFIISYSSTDRRLYMVKKLGSYYAGGGSDYHRFGYMKQKHFLLNSYNVYLLKQPSMSATIAIVDNNWVLAYRSNNYFGQPSIQYFDIENKVVSTLSWHYISVNLGSLTANTLQFDSTTDEHSDMVLAIKFVAATPFTSFYSTTHCSVESGVSNYNPLKPVTCELDTTYTQIILRNIGVITDTYVKIYYYAYTISSDQAGTQVEVRIYANSQAYASSGGWPFYYGTTPGFTIRDTYYISNTGYSSTSGPPSSYSVTRLYSSSWADTGGYAQILSVNTNSINVRLYRSSTISFPNVYEIWFRFYSERLTFNTCTGATMSSPWYGTNFRSYAGCGAFDKHFYVYYSYMSNGGQDFPTWHSGYYIDFTVTFNSITGDSSNDPSALYLHATISYFSSVYYYSNTGQCGCTYGWDWDCCWSYNYACRTPNDCRWYYGYNTFLLTGGAVTPFNTQSTLANSYSVDILSRQRGVQTQINLYVSGIRKSVGPSYNSFLLFRLADGQSYSSNNAFPSTRNADLGAYIDCKCVVGSSISISASTTYQNPVCVRYIIPNLDPSFAVYIDVPSGQNLNCFIPGHVTSSPYNPNYIRLQMYAMNNHFYTRYYPSMYYTAWSNTGAYQYYTDTGYSGGLNSVNENSFWSSSAVSAYRYYDLNVSSPYGVTNPFIYMVGNAPQPTQGMCNSGFLVCRAYTSFINRRYIIVAQYSGYTYTIRLADNTYYPPSKDAASGYYAWTINYGDPSQVRYYHTWTSSHSSGGIYPSNPSTAVQPSLYGTTLNGYPSAFMFYANLNGKTLYSNKRNYGEYQGSFIRLTINGLTSLFGCGATLANRLFSLSAPLYCEVKSSTVLEIRSRQDISITSTLHISIFTSSVPSTLSYTLQVFDKYVSGSDYALTLSVSDSFSRIASGFNLVQPTSILWRRQAYKQFQASSAPIRFIFNNNYQYVYDYNTPTNSDAIAIVYPGGISNSYTYSCFVKQYPAQSKHLYRSYEAPCVYYTTDTVRISAIPSHILSPDMTYEFVIYRNNNGASMSLTLNSGNFWATIQSLNTQASYNVIYQDFVLVRKYQSVYPITLSSIYTLTKEASATNSLYLSFVVNAAGSAFQVMDFRFDNLGLSSFEITNGDIIPCYLSPEFSTIGGKTIAPRCRGYANGINVDSPLIIRVEKFTSMTTGTNWKIAFDGFSNPAIQTLYMYPINVRISFIDRTNNKVYTSNFPNLYSSDSINRGVPAAMSGSLSFASNSRGASTYHYIATSWPYSSNYNDISQKVTLKLGGGITCCNAFSSFTLSDNRTGSGYTLLWTDIVSNISVYRTPSITGGWSTDLRILNVVNPYPIQKETYEQIKKMEISFYSGYQNIYIKQLDQLGYSNFAQLSQITVSTNFGSPTESTTSSYSFHNGYPITYDIRYGFTLNSFTGRNLDYTILNFTAGVQSIEAAYIRYQQSPYIVNPVLAVKIFKDNYNCWCLKITGNNDNLYSTTYGWYIRMRFYPNAVTLSYVSTTYAKNGQIEFSNSNSQSLSADGYSSSPVLPTTFEMFEKSYTAYFYSMQRKYTYATAGLTSKKLQFRFTPPYSISSVQSFNINLPVQTALIPQNTPSTITCIIQPTLSLRTTVGLGLYAPCSYSTGVYTINAPIGGLTLGQEYTISILERNQTTTTFTLPVSPVRYEISFIYNSNLALKFGDTYIANYMALMNSFSVNHLILKQATSNFIGFTFTPQFTLTAASLTAPITESVLEIQFESRYFTSCLGIDTLFTNDGMTFQNGAYFTHYSSPAITNANTRILCGQYSASYTPTKLRVTDYGQFTAGTSYYFRFPMIMNPNTYNIPFIYKIRLLSYANTNFYPTTIGYYEYNGLQQTNVGNTYQTQEVRTTVSNAYVQNTLTLGVYYPYYNPPNGAQIAYKFKNSDLGALASLASLPSISNSNYAYEYYPNINLCMFKRNTGNTVNSFSLGNFPTTSAVSTFTTAYIYTYHDTSNIYYSDFNPNSYKTDSITYITSWSSSAITKVSGLTNTNSMGVYTIAFSSSGLAFPEGSYMIMTLTSNFYMFDDYCKQISGFVQGTTITTSNLICRKNGPQDILIAGYNSIAAGTSLSVTLYLQIIAGTLGTYYPYATITVYSATGAKIIQADTNYYTLIVSSYGPSTLGIMNYMEQTLKKDTAQQLDFSFTLTSNTLGTGDYVIVDFGNWTIDQASIQGRLLWRYRVGSNIYWVPSIATLVSGNQYKIPVYLNYSMPANQLISVKVVQQLADAYIGVYFTQIQYNYLSVKAHNAANTLLQHQYIRLWIPPYQQTTLQVTPILTYTGATTLYDFSFTPNVSAAIGDVISVEFVTNDLYQTSLFSETLGRTMFTNNSYEMSCHETNFAGVITSPTNPISCELFQGSASSSPPIPTVVQIPIRNAISANTQIKFNILNILNPSVASYPIGITVKLMTICDSTDQNRLCQYYKSTKYIYFVNPPGSIPTVCSSCGNLGCSPNVVSATNTQHTFSASYTVNSGDYLRIVYYPQVAIPKVCSLSSANGVCYSYPAQNTIIIKASTTQSGFYSFTLAGMTNMYQSRQVTLPSIEIWDAVTGLIRAKHQPSYWVNHITTDPTSSNPLTITFTPTLTPNYQLKYQFNNIARIQMTYLLQNSKVNMIYLTSPGEVTISTSYCNATMQTLTSEAAPYPYRFQCVQMGSNSVMLYKQDNFPAWIPAHINRKVIVYLKYQIADWKTVSCNNWNVATYTITSGPNSWYRVSEGVGNFNIIEYLSPYIYKINFPTKAFSKRTCRTNQLCMFYGYLLPSTPVSSPIRYMTYTLPKQFGYSNLTTYTNCKMEQKNDDFNPTTCTSSRTNSDVTIKFVPTTYNHNYKLITIDTSDQSKLFKAPAYPGTHYQMKVNLFTASNVLMQSMYVNVTTVYGSLLDYNFIFVRIPKDANSIGLYEFKFRVGTTDILPGYTNSATNKITSKIEIGFSKSFASDLGTSKYTGDEVACLAISGIALASTGKLTCKIYPSYTTVDYPRIEVMGYDRILASTDVVIRIAGLKTLAVGVEDYIKIGVSLTYYDYGQVKGYVYEPTGIIVGGTTAAVTPKVITTSVSESSSNFVGDLVNYTFTGSIDVGFAPVTTTDYVGVQFDSNVFEGVFSLNSKSVCSLAASGQCFSFGLSKLIYFQPASIISSTTLNFNLNNVINSAYSFEYINSTFKVFTLVGDKVNALGTTTITKFSKPSPNVSAIITKVDSLYGGDSGTTYYFQLKLNHNLPKNGLISVEFPSVYDSLYTLNSQCVLSSAFPWGTYCEIVNSKMLIIRPNGNLLSPSLAYQFLMTNITNPNLKLSTYSFVITTQFNDNIYYKLLISRSSFACPEISVISVKTCTTFEVIIGAQNAFFETVYEISLICPSYIKEASELQIFLNWNPDPVQGVCTSGTDSLYSYQCAVTQQYQGAIQYTYLSSYLKAISPQKLISIKAKIKNGRIGTYSLVANVSYKGFTYLSTNSNRFFINSDTVQNLSNTQMTLKNYPINRAENAIYTLTIPKPAGNSVSSISDINIQISSLLSVASGRFSCGSLSQTFRQNYFSLLLNSNNNGVTCSANNNIIKLSNVSGLINALGTDDFLRLSFYRLKNSNVSVPTQDFKVSFLDTSSGTGIVLSSGTVSFPLSVSPPPANLQINKVLTVSPKLLVRNTYTMNLTTAMNAVLSINSQSQIGLIINFPAEFKLIWSRIETLPVITAVFSTVTPAASVTYTVTASGINGTLLANFSINAAFNFTQVIISFTFINPSQPIDCSAPVLFNIALIDFLKNSLIAETLSNNVQCPLFTDKLYQVNVSGNAYMEAGKVYEYTISIEKPAQYLKITPTIQTSAITFDPSVITFYGYGQTIKTFKVKVSTGLSGIFPLSFVKFQYGSDIFYNDIPSINITTKASTRNYSVTFTPIDIKSIGLPIEIQASLQEQNSKQFTLVYTHNCSSGFTLNPVSFKNLSPGTKNTSISITYTGSTIPSMCVIDFSISSVTSNNYVIATTRLFVTASKSIDRSSTVPAMRLQIGPTYKESSDVGSTILSQQTQQIKPIVYSLNLVSSRANSAAYLASVSEPGVIYFAVVKIGTNPTKVTQSDIYNKSVATGVSYGSASTSLSNTISTIQASLNANSLQSQTKYMIGAYVNTSVGVSDIKFELFETKKSSNGAAITIAFSNIQTNAYVIDALSKTLRIIPSRINILTVSTILTMAQSTYSNTVMNTRQYVYDVVIGPNSQDDSIRPIDLVDEFSISNDQLKKMSVFLPSFISTYSMSTREIIVTTPKFRGSSSIKLLSVTHESTKIAVSFWQQANVYAVIVPTPTERLLSAQIVGGFDQDNNQVTAQHFKYVVSDTKGQAEIEFTLLDADTSYNVFVTAENVVPYQPRQRIADGDIQLLEIKTGVNLNLKDSEQTVVKKVRQINPTLADAVDEHIKDISNKKKTSANSQNGYNNNKWWEKQGKRRVVKPIKTN